MLLFDTLLIFLWKHYKCIRFSWASSLLNVSMPVLMAFAVMYLMNLVEVHVNTEHLDLTDRHEVIGKVRETPTPTKKGSFHKHFVAI